MGMPVEKVEVGFDLTGSIIAPFFVLDDPVKGVLDNSEYVIAGTIFFDITDRVRRFSINRGRKSQFTFNPAGYASIELNNHDRAFDPLYLDSPFYGNIVPRREMRVTTADEVQFSGWVEDWNLTYLPNGDSVASAECVDATSILASQNLTGGTPTPELSGARINTVLDDSGVAWPAGLRDIDAGGTLLGDQEIPEGINALSYLQQIARSEPGEFFVGKTGQVNFRDRNFTATSGDLVVFGGTGINFVGIEVVYGSEQLYNQVIVSRLAGGTAIAADLNSQTAYGIRTLVESDLLMANDLEALDLAVQLADKLSTPEYRIDTLEVQLSSLDPADQVRVLELEIGRICKVEFTPNNIGDPIEQFIQIIRIQHTVDPENHFIEFGFRELTQAYLVLDDAEFGKLDEYILGR
jgi:hypothetical protein